MTDPTVIISSAISTAGLVAVAFLSAKNGRKVDNVHTVVQQIDAAVNGKAPGKTSISEDVTTILEKQEFDNPSPSDGDAGIRGELAALRAEFAEFRDSFGRS